MVKRTQNATKLEHGALRIGHAAPLWRTRRAVRKAVHAKHRIEHKQGSVPKHHRLLHVYRNVDEFATTFFPTHDGTISKAKALGRVRHMIRQLGYDVVEFDEDKPWGGMYRLADSQVERFIAEFFPGLSLEEAKLGRHNVRLSPKFLLVEPGKRLSWQYHHRRAERWHFLTRGSYNKSRHNAMPHPIPAPAGTIVQFEENERHRLSAPGGRRYTLIAEIWQHTDPNRLSDERDIVRLEDDYKRA